MEETSSVSGKRPAGPSARLHWIRMKIATIIADRPGFELLLSPAAPRFGRLSLGPSALGLWRRRGTSWTVTLC
jgi:hypothetical protein